MEEQGQFLGQVLHLSSFRDSLQWYKHTGSPHDQELISSPMKYLIKRRIAKSNTAAHQKALTNYKEHSFTKGRHLLSSNSNVTEFYSSKKSKCQGQISNSLLSLGTAILKVHFFIIKKITNKPLHCSQFFPPAHKQQNTPWAIPSPHPQKHLEPKHFLLPTAGAQQDEGIIPNTPPKDRNLQE